MTSPVRIEADYLIEIAGRSAHRRGNHGGRAVERNVRRRARRNAGAQATRRRPGGADRAARRGIGAVATGGPADQSRRPVAARPGDAVVATRQYRRFAAEPHHRRRRQPLGIASAHRAAADRPAAAAGFRRRLCRTEVRRRWNAGTHGRARPSADRHHHQAECRPQPDRDGKSRGHAVRGRDRFHQGR